jgi:hypothetical protein
VIKKWPKRRLGNLKKTLMKAAQMKKWLQRRLRDLKKA